MISCLDKGEHYNDFSLGFTDDETFEDESCLLSSDPQKLNIFTSLSIPGHRNKYLKNSKGKLLKDILREKNDGSIDRYLDLELMLSNGLNSEKLSTFHSMFEYIYVQNGDPRDMGKDNLSSSPPGLYLMNIVEDPHSSLYALPGAISFIVSHEHLKNQDFTSPYINYELY